jgi:ankyrin repeat protein
LILIKPNAVSYGKLVDILKVITAFIAIMNFAMNSISRLIRSIFDPSSSAIENQRENQQARKAPDCVFIVGPGNEGRLEHLKWKASQRGLTSFSIGDGSCNVTQEMIKKARSDGHIGPNTEVICVMHGLLESPARYTQTHKIQISAQKNINEEDINNFVSTMKFVRWLREPLDGSSNSVNPEFWQGNIHMAACYVGSLNDELNKISKNNAGGLKSENSVFSQGNLALYGSGKLLSTYVLSQNFDHLIDYLGDCKRGDKKPEADTKSSERFNGLFDRMKSRSVEKIIFIRQGRSGVDILKSPKSINLIEQDFLQGKLRQKKINKEFEKSEIHNSSKPVIFSNNKISDWKKELSSEGKEKVRGFVLTRLAHLKSNKKLEILKSDMAANPWLTSIRIDNGVTPLMFVSNVGSQYDDAEVKAGQIAEVLINAGANPHDRDSSGLTAAHYAAKQGNSDVLDVVLKSQENVGLSDRRGATVLHAATSAPYNRAAVVKTVLKYCEKSLINQRNIYGQTALHIAIKAGDDLAVKELLEAGADPGMIDFRLRTPIALAKKIDGEASQKILALLKNTKENKKSSLN